MKSINELIEQGREALEEIFASNGIKAPVNESTVSNAVLVLPKVKADIIAKFDGFDDFDEFDDVTGKKLTPEQKAAKKAKRKENLQKAFVTVKDTAAKVQALRSGGEVIETEEPKKEPKKILGLSPTIFWVSLAILLLIISLIVVKVVKK